MFATMTADQVTARLDEVQIANARMNDMHAVWQHPQLDARARWTQVDTPHGPVPALLPPGKTAACQARMDAVPDIAQMRAQAAIGLDVMKDLTPKNGDWMLRPGRRQGSWSRAAGSTWEAT